MTRIAVLAGPRRGPGEPHGGFGVLDDIASTLTDDEVVVVHQGEDPGPAARAEIGFGGPNPERIRGLLAAAPALGWYHTMSAGVERILPAIADRPELVLTNNSGAYDAPIAEHVIATILAAAKRLHVSSAAQRRHEWHEDLRSQDVRGATLVVLGMGSIGGEVARLASALGMRVVGVRRGGADGAQGPERLADVAAEADYLAVCAPLTAETRGLVGAEVLARMRPTAWVVNISRGAVIDESALLDALRERRIGGAALDAWWDEPLPPDSPWWDLDNVIVTPHTSYSSPTLRERTVALVAENLRRWRAGEPLLNVVDRGRGY